jgi:hypothetical protein
LSNKTIIPLRFPPISKEMSFIVTPSNFDKTKLTVSEVKKLENGSSQVYINYDGKRLRVQGPRLPIPYNAGDYQGNQKYKVQFSFRDRNSNPKVAAYVKMLEEIDSFVVDQATKNAGKWFKMAGASREMINLFYTPSIKVSKDKDGNVKDYPPSQAVNLKQRNGSWMTEIYDEKKQLLEGVSPMEVLRKGAEVTPMSDASSIWIADKKFGLVWSLYQTLINVPGEGGGFGCQIQDEDDVVVASGVSAKEEKSLMEAVMPSADADEDEEDEEEEDEVIPAPPVPKKAVAAKKVVKKVAAAK